MKQNKSISTILRPANALLKQAIEAPRKRLCNSEEIEAKKKHAVKTRKRKQSEKEAIEMDERNKEKWAKMIAEESQKYEEMLRNEEIEKSIHAINFGGGGSTFPLI